MTANTSPILLLLLLLLLYLSSRPNTINAALTFFSTFSIINNPNEFAIDGRRRLHRRGSWLGFRILPWKTSGIMSGTPTRIL